MLRHWILDAQGRPIEVDLMTWAEWFEVDENRLQFNTDLGLVRVTTIFMGIDQSFGHSKTPVLWETMALGEGLEDPPQYRCAGSREQAQEMHERVVAEVCAAMGIEPTSTL